MQASARLSSSAASKKVIAGVSSTITRSCYRASRGKANSAPLSAQEPPPKGPKRISKQERRVRIEEFVEKYRASNEGKFPTITNVRQQVGGGHYTVREILQELEYNHANDKTAQVQRTAELELSRPKDDYKSAQVQVTAQKHSCPKDDLEKNPYNRVAFVSDRQDDVLISQKDDTTGVGTVKKTETWRSTGSSHEIVETEGAKQDLETPDNFKHVDGPTLSDQTESDSMKVLMNKPSMSLGVGSKLDPGKQQGETEAYKFDLPLDASKSTASDQSGSGKVVKANMPDREHSPKHELEESTKTGLLGSLKSLAHGIRNFWNKL